MERKKQSKGRGWERCYVKKNYGMFGVEMRAYGHKLVKFCTHTHTHTYTRGNLSSIDMKKSENNLEWKLIPRRPMRWLSAINQIHQTKYCHRCTTDWKSNIIYVSWEFTNWVREIRKGDQEKIARTTFTNMRTLLPCRGINLKTRLRAIQCTNTKHRNIFFKPPSLT